MYMIQNIRKFSVHDMKLENALTLPLMQMLTMNPFLCLTFNPIMDNISSPGYTFQEAHEPYTNSAPY